MLSNKNKNRGPPQNLINTLGLFTSRNVNIISKILDLHVYEWVCLHQNLLAIYHTISLKRHAKTQLTFLFEEKL